MSTVAPAPPPRRHRAAGIIRALVSNYARQAIDVLVFLLLTPYVARTLGKEGFGLWSLMWAVVGMFALFDFGYSGSVVKYVADARGRGDTARLGHVTATLFWIHMMLGAVLLVAACVCAPFIAGWFRIAAGREREATAVFLVLACRAAASMPLGMFTSVLAGLQKQVASNAAKTANTVVYALAVPLALGVYPTTSALAAVNLGSYLVFNAAIMLGCLWQIRTVRIAPWLVRLELLREISSFSVYSLVIQLSLLVYTRIDSIVIQRFLSLTQVAFYSVAMQTVNKAGLFCKQSTSALTPVVAELKGAGEDANIRAVFEKGSKLTIALATPLLAGLIWFAADLVNAWMTPEYAAAITPLRWLAAATFVSMVHSNASLVLSMTGHQRFVSFAFVGGQIVNLSLTLVLVKPLGITGVALATFVACCLCDGLVISVHARRLYHFGTWAFYRATLMPALVPCATMLGALWLVQQVFPADRLWRIAVLEGAGCLVFFATFYAIGLNAKERTYYSDRLRRSMSRAPAQSGGASA